MRIKEMKWMFFKKVETFIKIYLNLIYIYMCI